MSEMSFLKIIQISLVFLCLRSVLSRMKTIHVNLENFLLTFHPPFYVNIIILQNVETKMIYQQTHITVYDRFLLCSVHFLVNSLVSIFLYVGWTLEQDFRLINIFIFKIIAIFQQQQKLLSQCNTYDCRLFFYQLKKTQPVERLVEYMDFKKTKKHLVFFLIDKK